MEQVHFYSEYLAELRVELIREKIKRVQHIFTTSNELPSTHAHTSVMLIQCKQNVRLPFTFKVFKTIESLK